MVVHTYVDQLMRGKSLHAVVLPWFHLLQKGLLKELDLLEELEVNEMKMQDYDLRD